MNLKAKKCQNLNHFLAFCENWNSDKRKTMRTLDYLSSPQIQSCWLKPYGRNSTEELMRKIKLSIEICQNWKHFLHFKDCGKKNRIFFHWRVLKYKTVDWNLDLKSQLEVLEDNQFEKPGSVIENSIICLSGYGCGEKNDAFLKNPAKEKN